MHFSWQSFSELNGAADGSADHDAGRDATVRGGGDSRLTPLTASLATRLGGVCRGWDRAEFDALVEQIARRKLDWADQGYQE